MVGNNTVYDDEIVYNRSDNQVIIKGMLYNMNDYEKAQDFKRTIDDAWDKLHTIM